MMEGFYLRNDGLEIIEIKKATYFTIPISHPLCNWIVLFYINSNQFFNLRIWSSEIEVIFGDWIYLEGSWSELTGAIGQNQKYLSEK